MSVALHWPVGPSGRLISDFGEIEHPAARPDRDELGHLMLMPADWFTMLLVAGPVIFPWGGRWSGTVDPDTGRTYAHLDYQPWHWGCPHRPRGEVTPRSQRWTWELIEAHWADFRDRRPMLIGRWPD